MLTQQEIDEFCEDAVRIALEQNIEEIASSKHVATDGKTFDIGSDTYRYSTIIPLVRVWPGI